MKGSIAVVFVAALALPALGGWAASAAISPLSGAAGSPSSAILEGFIVAAVLFVGECVVLRVFGRWVRLRAATEWLAARNARIRSGSYAAGTYTEANPL